MTRDKASAEIKRNRNLLEQRKRDLIRFAAEESWWNVLICAGDCIGYSKLIDEYEYLEELAEYDGEE